MSSKTELPSPRWTKNERELLVRLADGTRPARLVAKKIGRSLQAVQSYAERQGISLAGYWSNPKLRKMADPTSQLTTANRLGVRDFVVGMQVQWQKNGATSPKLLEVVKIEKRPKGKTVVYFKDEAGRTSSNLNAGNRYVISQP